MDDCGADCGKCDVCIASYISEPESGRQAQLRVMRDLEQRRLR